MDVVTYHIILLEYRIMNTWIYSIFLKQNKRLLNIGIAV